MSEAAPSDVGEPAWPDDAVEVGRIVGAWGVKGAFRVQPYADSPQALYGSRRWFLQAPPAPRAPTSALPRLLCISHVREQGEGIVAQAHDIADRDAALALCGARIFVARSSFPTPGEGEYYWVDLIGSRVCDRGGRVLGQVSGLIDVGPHAVLQVQPGEAGGAEILIPFVAAFVDEVDVAGKRIVVDWTVEA